MESAFRFSRIKKEGENKKTKESLALFWGSSRAITHFLASFFPHTSIYRTQYMYVTESMHVSRAKPLTGHTK